MATETLFCLFNCTRFIFIQLLHLIVGFVLVAPITLISFISATITSVIWVLPDAGVTFYAIWKTKRWGPNIKFLLTILVPFVTIFWIPTSVIGSLIFGIFYGLFGPLVISIINFFGSNNTLLKSVSDTFKYAGDVIQWFWDLNKNHKTEMRKLREYSDGNRFDIPLWQIPVGLFIVLISGTFSMIIHECIIVIMYIFITARLYIYVVKHLFYKTDALMCCLVCMCSVPIFASFFLIPLVGIIMLMLAPFYSFYGGIRAAMYSYNTNKLVNCIYYTIDFNKMSWYSIVSFSFDIDHNYNFSSDHLDYTPEERTRTRTVISPISPTPSLNFSVKNNSEPKHTESSQLVNKVTTDLIWNKFFEMCTLLATDAIRKNLISKETVETIEPSIIQGLPAYVIIKLLERSPESKEFVLHDGITINELNRPTNTFVNTYPNSIWEHLITLQEMYLKLKLDENEITYVEKFLITCNDKKIMSGAIKLDNKREGEIHRFCSKINELALTISIIPMFQVNVQAALNNSLREKV